MSKLSQFFFNDRVGDYRDSSDFITSDPYESFDVYDDGHKFYIRTGVALLNPPDRIKNNVEIMNKWGRMSCVQRTCHAMYQNPNTGVYDDGIVHANGHYFAASGTYSTSAGTTLTSLLLKSNDEFATFQTVDTYPYVHQHIVTANGVMFAYASEGELGQDFQICRANLIKSADGGETWTACLDDSIPFWQVWQVYYAQNTYVAVTTLGIFYSTDAYGDTWQRLEGPWSSTIRTSNDFWYYITLPSQTPVYQCTPRGITWSGTYWYIMTYQYVQSGSPGWGTQVYYNADLTANPMDWKPCTVADKQNAYTKIVTTGSKIFLLKGGTISSQGGLQHNSSATVFTQATGLSPTGAGGGSTNNIVYNSNYGKYYVATANGIWNSSDGATWTKRTSYNSEIFRDVVNLGNEVLSVGIAGSSSFNVWITTAADTLTNTQNTATRVEVSRAIVANGKAFLFGAYGHSGFSIQAYVHSTIFTTTDGSTLTLNQNFADVQHMIIDSANTLIMSCNTSLVRYNAANQVYTNHILPGTNVANGIMETANNLYLASNCYSSDLITWTKASGTITGGTYNFAMNPANGMLVMATISGSYYSTSNGTSWTTMSLAMDEVGFAEGHFVGINRSSGRTSFSNTGTSWFSANTQNISFVGMTWDPERQIYLGCANANNFMYATFSPADPLSGPITLSTTSTAHGGNTSTIAVHSNTILRSGNSNNVVVFDMVGAKAFIVSPNSYKANLSANQGGTYCQGAYTCGDLVFVEDYVGSFGNSYGSPSVRLAMHYLDTLDRFRTNCIVTGLNGYATGTSLRHRNLLTTSLKKYDDKYWLPPNYGGHCGWSQYKKDYIYIPGDGTQFLRIV